MTAKIIRAPIEIKTKILFNFIKSNIDDGISYKQFLKMVIINLFSFIILSLA